MEDQRENTSPQESRDMSRIEELLNQETYTVPEAAEVLNMSQRRILSAVYGGELDATMAGHDIVSISRTALVAWLRRQEM